VAGSDLHRLSYLLLSYAQSADIHILASRGMSGAAEMASHKSGWVGWHLKTEHWHSSDLRYRSPFPGTAFSILTGVEDRTRVSIVAEPAS
jgi:hypothetical protein